MKRAGIICVLILMSLFRASGQEVFHLGTDEGLGGRQTFSVVRDRKGFIWISTRFGVDRYDGHDFKHYPVSILSKDKSPIRSIYLEMDRDSLLWAYTDNGTIYRYQESVDGFELYADLEHWIGTVHFDRYGRLWVAGKALFGYFDTEGKFVHADNEKARGADIRKLIDRNDSEMIIVAVDRIVCMDMNTSRTEFLVPQDRIQELGTRIETAFLDGDRLWIGTSGKGLFRLDGNSGNLEKMTGRLLDEHPVLTINMDSHGRLLLGTDGMGLCIYDREQDDIVSVFNKSANPPFRIAGDAVYGIYPSDRHEGEIWIATFSDGVNVIEEDSSPFHMLSMGGGHRRSRQACCLIETGDGSLWVATDNDIKVRVPGQDGWRTMLHGRNVLSLHEDAHGNIWAGTYSSGLYRLDRDGNILQHYIHGGENTIGTDYVYTIAEDIYGRIWTGGKKGRVSVLDPLTGRFSRVGVAQANHIVRYDDNTMLIASEDGVYMCHVDDLKAVPCPFNDNLYSQYVCDIAIGRDSTLWLATYGDGISRCRLSSDEVVRYTQNTGLASDIVYSLVLNGGDIWYSSEKGIGRLGMDSGEIVNFSLRNDGIFSGGFRQLSRTRGSDGTVYFGSYDGIVSFLPENVDRSVQPADIYFDNFSLFNRRVTAASEDSPLTDHIDNTGIIRLDHSQHSFSIGFTAIDFNRHGNRHFSWILEGLETDWNTYDGDRYIAGYTNLKPGRYVFRLRYLGDGYRIQDERSIAIEIMPALWNRPWARVLEIILFLGIIAGIVFYVRYRIDKRQTEEKIRFFVNTAHDIRTPLMLINNPLRHLKEGLPDNPKMHYMMDLILNNLDKLNAMLFQLIDFQKVYEHKEKLVVRRYDVGRYLEDKVVSWSSSASDKDILLTLSLPETTVEEWFDKEKMDRILDNLIANSIKYTESGGRIEVLLVSDPDAWKISIRDNGIGISDKDQKKLFSRFYRGDNAINSKELGSGLGLIIVKQYVSMLKGKISVSSTVGKGTCFTVGFAHGNASFAGAVNLDKDDIPVSSDMDAIDGQDPKNIVVLLAEDNAELRKYMQLSLMHHYKILVASDGAEAWDMIQRMSPDIVVSDAMMPRMTGFELCRSIKSSFETSHIPIILVTVSDDRESLSEGLAAGADDYIRKPFDMGYLRLKIDNIIHNRALMRHKFLGIGHQDPVDNDSMDSRFLAKAVGIIGNNISQKDFSISDLSRELGLSRTLLYNKFNAITGYTPNDFIKLVRMNRAIEYFKEKKWSIKEVSAMVGFDEPAYFSTCFKKIYGKTPRQFIDELLK